MALVSIIVPAYNVEKYITRCLDSLCRQTYRDIEIIVIDDGSNDKTGEICERFQKTDSRISVFHQINGGVSHARNKGIQYATGKYMVFVDADDWLDYDMIEFMVDGMEASNADIFACGYYVNDKPCLYLEHNQDKQVSNREFIMLCLEKDMALLGTALWNKIFKSSIVSKLQKMFDETLALGEDMDFLVRYLMGCNRCVYSLTPKYHYFKRGDSAVASINRGSLSVIRAHKNLYPYFSDDRQLEIILQNRLADSTYTLLHMAKNAKVADKDIIHQLQKTLKEIPDNCYAGHLTLKKKMSYLMLVFSYTTYIIYGAITREKTNEENRNYHNL